MNTASEPLVYLAIGFAGMFLCGWFFDYARKLYMPDTADEAESQKPSPLHTLLHTLGTVAGSIALWFVLYRTSLVVADILLLVALAIFSIASYKVRLRPLLVHGLTLPHLAALVAALGVWAIPMLWFMHLHLADLYGAA